jgi:hypothetical protein
MAIDTGTQEHKQLSSVRSRDVDDLPVSESTLDNSTSPPPSNKPKNRPRDSWFYPSEIKNDLHGVVDLPEEVVAETLACAWEYTRCVIPQFTNWQRYIAFTRIIVIGIVAEFRGRLVDVSAGDRVLGYDLGELFEIIFAGTPGHEDMAREYRAFLLITADKCSNRYCGNLKFENPRL